MSVYEPQVYTNAANLLYKVPGIAYYVKEKQEAKAATLWDWVKLNIFQYGALSSPGNAMGVMSGAAEEILKTTKPEISKTVLDTIGDWFSNLLAALWKPLKWVIGIAIFLFILWAFIGRKS